MQRTRTASDEDVLMGCSDDERSEKYGSFNVCVLACNWIVLCEKIPRGVICVARSRRQVLGHSWIYFVSDFDSFLYAIMTVGCPEHVMVASRIDLTVN